MIHSYLSLYYLKILALPILNTISKTQILCNCLLNCCLVFTTTLFAHANQDFVFLLDKQRGRETERFISPESFYIDLHKLLRIRRAVTFM